MTSQLDCLRESRTTANQPCAREGEAPAEPHSVALDHHATAQANANLLPNKLPQTPNSQQIGNLIAGVAVAREANHGSLVKAQTECTVTLTASDPKAATRQELSPNATLSCHETFSAGNLEPQASDSDNPLTDLLRRALAATKTRRGRPPTLDDQATGQLIALLSVGMSMRQAASVLGVSHTAVQKTLKADPALAEEITAARFQAQLQPLACVIREAGRSWKAATWLLKYLDTKIASYEETPDERNQRTERERQEFLARASGRHYSPRHVG